MACSSLLSDGDLRRFRTKPCRRNRQKGGRCEFGPDRCQYSHSEAWPRRCPFYLSNSSCIRYIPQICPEVVLGESCDSAWKTIGSVLTNRCTRGGACPFAHSLEEVLYHPLHYKTQVCPHFVRGECTTYYCPFVHGTAERRDVSTIKYNLPFQSDLFETSPFPNVEIISKIPTSSMSKTPSLCNRLDSHHPMPSNQRIISIPNRSIELFIPPCSRSLDFSSSPSPFQAPQSTAQFSYSHSFPYSWSPKQTTAPQSLDDSFPLAPTSSPSFDGVSSSVENVNVSECWINTSNKSEEFSGDADREIPHFPALSFQHSPMKSALISNPSITDSAFPSAEAKDLNNSIKTLLDALTIRNPHQSHHCFTPLDSQGVCQTTFKQQTFNALFQAVIESNTHHEIEGNSPSVSPNSENEQLGEDWLIQVGKMAVIEKKLKNSVGSENHLDYLISPICSSTIHSPASNEDQSMTMKKDLGQVLTPDPLVEYCMNSKQLDHECVEGNIQFQDGQNRQSHRSQWRSGNHEWIESNDCGSLSKPKTKIVSAAPKVCIEVERDLETNLRQLNIVNAKGVMEPPRRVSPPDINWEKIEYEAKQLGQLLQSIEDMNETHKNRDSSALTYGVINQSKEWHNELNDEYIEKTIEMGKINHNCETYISQWNQIREQMNKLNQIMNLTNL